MLVDPPFEEPGELERMAQGLAAAVRRFATGTYLLWYPIKDPQAVMSFRRLLRSAGYPKLLVAELNLRETEPAGRLTGTGLALLNPPFGLENQLRLLLAFLAERLAQGSGAGWRLDWLSDQPR